MSAAAVQRYETLAAQIRDRPARAGRTRVVGIDGPAGSGKSVFATHMSARLHARVICLDDLTPSWTGPDKEAALLVEQVLAPLAHGEPARYHIFDWVQHRYTEWRDVPPGDALVVEGVGAGSSVVRPYLTHLVWVEAPSALRLERGLVRDGEARRPDWERWRERENALFASERTREAADLLVDGAPTVLHDATIEYVRLER